MNRVMMPEFGVALCVFLLVMFLVTAPGDVRGSDDSRVEALLKTLNEEVRTINETAERRMEMMRMDMCLKLDHKNYYRASQHKQKRVEGMLGCSQLWTDLDRN